MPKGRLVFDGDNIYTEKDARIYKLKSSVSSKIDAIPWVVDSLDSTSATDALSANMGRQLQDQINSLSWTWKFLSTWDCTTWLPGTNPQEDPYTYKIWDYYVVSTTGSTNYKPHWGTYTQWVPSTTVELENVWTNDKYYFDGADWVRIPDTSIQIAIDTQLDTTSTHAVENRAIANAINTKQNIISDLSTIRAWAAAGSTALQRLDNITELTNNAGYQTAWDVASAIAWKANRSEVTAVQQDVDDLERDCIANFQALDDDLVQISSDISSLQTTVGWHTTSISSIQWDITALQTAVAWKADGADINTKTFTITSTSDLTNAQAAYEWTNSWKNAIIVYEPERWLMNSGNAWVYSFLYMDSGSPVYVSLAPVEQSSSQWVGWRSLTKSLLKLVVSGTSVVSMTVNHGVVIADFLSTSQQNYPYTPANNYDPATKKYVDDTAWDIQTDLATKQDTLVSWTNIKTINNQSLLWSENITINWILSWPLVPAASAQYAWKIFYCTFDNTFYKCDWTQWTEIWSWWTPTWAITNNTTWTTSTISQEWVGTKAEFEALSSYWNIIYNIIE